MTDWNELDPNIKFKANINQIINFIDVRFENRSGQLVAIVFHKPSYEPYYLPFNSVHPMHMKRNIPFAALLQTIRYSSSFQLYIKERENIRMALFLNKYLGEFIDRQFGRVLSSYTLDSLNESNFNNEREKKAINLPRKEDIPIDYCV